MLAGADGDWRSAPPPRMGLVDGAGTLLDGLYRAATVPAGGVGVWTLADADPDGLRRVRAAGTIEVAGPVPPASVPFEVSAEVD